MISERKILTKDEACSVFLQYHDYVRLVAFHVAPTRSLQEDIAQDVFIEFTENAKKWQLDGTEGCIKGVLRALTRNIALRYWRLWKREQPEYLSKIAEMIYKETTPEEDLHSNLEEQIAALVSCLEKLTPANRDLVELFYYKGITSKELLLRTKRKAGTVYSLLSRIRNILLDCVQRTLRLEVSDA